LTVLVVDTSALIAMLFAEPDEEVYATALGRAEPVISAGSLIETLRVADRRRGASGRERVWRLLADFEVQVWPVDEAQVRRAEEGLSRFGKGRGAPPAVLNLGDLFAYALARHLDAPLLFKGEDFPHTDVRPAFPA
jgi:ribonuclease VapC